MTIDNVGGPSVISNNSAGRSGGGLWLNHPNTTSTISKVTFSGNGAGDDGGAIRLGSSTPGNVLNVSFSRFVSNTASSGKASGLSVCNGNATATNNWWGCSTGPSAAPCDGSSTRPPARPVRWAPARSMLRPGCGSTSPRRRTRWSPAKAPA
ncbi:MAG: hypothetical protein R3E79_46780 [Caldilineaceae bacterium]